ncbi:hypothetical protein HPDFL43_06822 [Hoeflea phototrophica DFL-43]|uniref:Uncharacterized protein n=2 Tax=Hoeflea TaxID=274591 RepID=A9DCN6_HOEPD|nr:hypothetical protein HPDFL43_06822 [Hoeflea phototrophica DFL-43]
MSFPVLHPSRFLQLFAVMILTLTLAACAGRPKPLEPQYPVDVTSVRVTAISSADVGFAAQLQDRLEQTLGRAARDVGRASTLRVIVSDRSTSADPFLAFVRAGREAEVEVLLNDNESGLDVRTRVLRASASGQNNSLADSILVARLVSDIRNLLGLSGYPPYPVSGAKRDLVRPEFRDDLLSPDGSFSEDELRSDPLLNGSVTPTSIVLEPEENATPAFDISNPLLSVTPPAPGDDAAAPVPVAPPAIEPVGTPEADVEVPAEPVASASPAPATINGDEPCIITMDNDCSDPDRR